MDRLAELQTMPYSDYLRTPEWAAKRRAAVEHADYRCQVCNADNFELHVHHRTYEWRGNERPADLTVLCSRCHRTFHIERPAWMMKQENERDQRLKPRKKRTKKRRIVRCSGERSRMIG